MARTDGDTDLPIARGAVGGVAAYVVGYLLTYVWHSDTAREMLRGINFFLEFFGGEPIATWKAVGWLFYNAHFVAVTHPTFGRGQGQTNFIASGDVSVLLYAVPLVLVLVAAAVIAYTSDAEAPAAGGLAGSLVVVGYLPLALIGVLVFRATRDGATIAIDPVTGILLAGIVYPVVVGAIGGVFGSAFVDESAGRRL